MQLKGKHVCGCAILAPKTVLTAAHCVYKQSVADLKILVGTNDLSAGGQYYQIESYMNSNNYPSPYSGDISIVHTKDTIEFNDRVKPIELSTAVEVGSGGFGVQLFGYGLTKVSLFLFLNFCINNFYISYLLFFLFFP